MEAISQNPRIRFGAFEVLLRSGELHKFGIRIKLQDQPFQVLVILLEHPGELVTREELQQKLWPADTFVDFDTSLNSAIKKLRDALADSAEEPRYIETVPRRGYRFIAQAEGTPKPTLAVMGKLLAPVTSAVPALGFWNKRRSLVAAGAAALVVIVALASWRIFFARPVLTGTDVILLASFTNKTGDPIFDNSLDKALQIKLTESPFLSVLPEGSVRETLRTMRRETNEPLTRDVGIEICKRQGLKAVVVPEIAAVGSKYLITLEAIDARSQKPIARAQMQADSKDQVIAAAGQSRIAVTQAIGRKPGFSRAARCAAGSGHHQLTRGPPGLPHRSGAASIREVPRSHSFFSTGDRAGSAVLFRLRHVGERLPRSW
jgi:DNA-binding winged helix-turn-helix (wHTH) protein